MSEPIIVESFRYDHWPTLHHLNKAINYRMSELRQKGYACEEVLKEVEDNGEVKQCRLLRAVKYPKPTVVRPEMAEA